MLKIIVFAIVLAAVALSGATSVASAETVPSPLQQVRDGVPTGEVICSDDRVLMLSPSGSPACVFEASGEMLEQRGFVKISGADSEESSTNDAEQRPPLHRGPAYFPLTDNTARLKGSFEVITGSLDELRSAKHAPRQSSSDEFVVADWIPDYIPDGYQLVYTLHRTGPEYNGRINHYLDLYFIPDFRRYLMRYNVRTDSFGRFSLPEFLKIIVKLVHPDHTLLPDLVCITYGMAL